MKNKKSIKQAENLCPLTALELEVMGVVWELGECGSTEVIDGVNEIRSLAPTTIRTVLTKLRDKGYIELIPTVQRQFRFKATVPRGAVARRSLRELLKSFFQGSPREAIAYLLDETEMSDGDFDDIRRMIEKHKKH